MYTELKAYQIIIALLKKYGIRHCVLSAGSRNVPFVHSVEEDEYFLCYSVVDERSAGYFALGLAQETQEPVVISCTSSTAACNYYPAVAEAFYQRVPIIVLTSDRDPARLHQLEDQMIDQVGMYDRHVVKSVNLPIVRDHHDEIWCQRLVNEALLELTHLGGGPVHINVPMVNYNMSFITAKLPSVTKVERINYESDESLWNVYTDKLRRAKRILVTPGQSSYITDAMRDALRAFFERYNAAVSVDYMANLDADFAINTSLCWESRNITNKKFLEFLPDIVISYGGNIFQGVKEMLSRNAGNFEHWLIQPDGQIVDVYRSIRVVFACSPAYFFKTFAERAGEGTINDMAYHRAIELYAASVKLPSMEFNNVYAIRSMVERIPSGSILHLAINGAIRITNYSKLQPHIKVYANIGTHGIDGCLSSFLGQAVARDSLCYLVIGDLSFFYDMNALRIRHIKNNVRILVINNHGGEEFYYNDTYQNSKSDLHTTARHNTRAEGWVRENGFKYLAASDAQTYDRCLEEFMCDHSDQPILFEVFTEMSTDARALHNYFDQNKSGTDKAIQKGKDMVKSIIGQEGSRKLKEKLKR